jgi:hypothetical protein
MTLTRTYPPPILPPQIQSCQDIAGKWLSLFPLTTYFSTGESADVNIALELISASDSLCNYFGNEYLQDADSFEDPVFQQSAGSLAVTAFPGYLGAKEGDNLFLSLAGRAGNESYAPANVEVCPGGQTAKIYIDAFCFVQDGQNVCSSKNDVILAKFPDSATQIVGKTQSQLLDELEEQTDDVQLQFC